jgi:hypothetical protein
MKLMKHMDRQNITNPATPTGDEHTSIGTVAPTTAIISKLMCIKISYSFVDGKNIADERFTGKEDFEFLTQDDLSMLPIIDQRKLKKLCKKENGNGEKKLEIYGKKIADERFTGNDPDISYGVEGKTQNDSAPDLIIGGGLY